MDKNDPDFHVYSLFGGKWGKYKDNDEVTKVFYSAENIQRNISRIEIADYTISHHVPECDKFGEYIDPERHFQMPIYLRVFGPERMKKLNKPFDVEVEFDRKERFCCLVTRHEYARVRGNIFKKIHNEYKHVDSAGDGWNTMDGWTVPGWWPDLKKFARKYKFMIAVENRSVLGYTSEKLYNALRSRTVPIYWGNSEVDKLFNPDCFIDLRDFDSYSEAVEYIEYVDNNDEVYKEILGAPKFPCPVEEHPVYNKENILNKTKMIFD